MISSYIIVFFGILFVIFKSKKFYSWLYTNYKFSNCCYPIQHNISNKNLKLSNDLSDLADLVPSPDNKTSIWLRSCKQEIFDPIEGEVFGEIPLWLNGSLYRNGPGSWHVKNFRFRHLFDCSALLHRFSINKGHVTYQNRFVDTETRRRNIAAQRIVITEFGTSALPETNHCILDKLTSLWNPTGISDNSLISIYPIGSYLYTFAESAYIHRINPTTLSTEERICISDYVNIMQQSSHPHIMTDGSIYNIGIGLSVNGPAYKIIHYPAAKNDEPSSFSFVNARIVATIPCRWKLYPSYMHSFGVTENYFILIEQPLTVSLTSYLKGKMTNTCHSASLEWFNLEPVHFYVIDKKSGKLEKTFYTDTFFYFHIINQYELSENYIVVDVCCYNDAKMISYFNWESLKEIQECPEAFDKIFYNRTLRFILPLKAIPNCTSEIINKDNEEKIYESNLQFNRIPDRVYEALSGTNTPTAHYRDTIDLHGNLPNLINIPLIFAEAYRIPDGRIFMRPELLCLAGCEMPSINQQLCSGSSYQYFYAISSDICSKNMGKLLKVDLLNRLCFEWYEPFCYLSEPIFVPSPNSQHEDDGVVLATMLWSNEDQLRKIGLLILCAKTWTEIGRCVFQTPEPVPKCLHGWFESSEDK